MQSFDDQKGPLPNLLYLLCIFSCSLKYELIKCVKCASQKPAHHCLTCFVLQEHGISPHPYMEFYKNDKTYFVAPLDKNEEFYVPEYGFGTKKEAFKSQNDE